MKLPELSPGDALRRHQHLPPKLWMDLKRGNAQQLVFDRNCLCIGPHGLYVRAAGGGL